MRAIMDGSSRLPQSSNVPYVELDRGSIEPPEGIRAFGRERIDQFVDFATKVEGAAPDSFSDELGGAHRIGTHTAIRPP
ncbi:MAG: hypothetical protein AAFO62_12820, partial [Pseudomonadota bacterium]